MAEKREFSKRNLHPKLGSSQILKLIKLYRSHELLWNIHNVYYRRYDLRVNAYNAIANEVGLPPKIVKKKLRSLRCTYMAERKRIERCRKTGPADDPLLVPTLFWFNKMRFLDNSIIWRKPKANPDIGSPLRNSLDESDQVTHKSKANQDVELSNGNQDGLSPRKSLDELDQANEGSFSNEDYMEEDVESNTSQQDELFSDLQHSKSSIAENSLSVNEALDKLININQEKNEFKAFSACVAAQLKSLPKEDAYLLMGEIQNLLTKCKLKNLKNQKSS